MAHPSRQDFGGSLREARERAGVTLRAISTSTKISVVTLEALERNDLSRLPGGLFTRAFIRSYAREVSLDPEETLQRYLQQFPEAAGDAELREAGSEGLEGPPRSRGVRVLRTVAWMLPIVVGVAYFAFLGSGLEWGGRRPSQAPRPHVPSPPPAAAPARSSQPTETSTTPPEPLAAPAPSPQPPREASTTPPDQAVVPRVAEPTVAEASQTGAATTTALAPAGTLRVGLAATGPCWVSLRSDGAVVYSGLMQAGDRREFDVPGVVLLTAGDAAALGFTINGETGRSLGGSGAVATVRFSADTFRSVLAGR